MSNRPMYKREDPTAAFLDYFGIEHMAPLPDDEIQIWRDKYYEETPHI